MDYPIVIVPLSEEDGGGYMGFVPDLTGCMSDGETREEALKNTLEAIDEWLVTAKNRKMEIPGPGAAVERARKRKAALLEKLKEVAGGMDQIETRLQDLEKVTTDLEERLEHADAWDRFGEITGLAVSKPSGAKKALHC